MTTDRVAEENQLLHDLVALYAPSGREGPAAEFLRDVFLRWGMNARIDEVGNVIGEIGEGSPTVCFLGHIDTVTGEIPVRREGNVLYGRGTVDAKGPLAAAACAAARLPRDIPKKIVIVGAVGEEAPNSPGASYFVHRLRPDFAIIGEPSRWDRITVGYKGVLHYKWTLSAPRLHSAAESPSATDVTLASFAGIVERGNESSESAFERVTGRIRSFNTREDDMIETATMSADIRLPPSRDPDALEQEIRERARKETAGNAMIDVIEKLPAVVCDKNSRLVRAMLAAIRRHGGRPRFVRKTGTSDMNLVAPVWRCPMAAYGPGDSNLDHTPNEHIDLDEYQRAIAVLETTFLNL
jgi:LysW-gamma-L-lysine carboxypeptidase